MLPWWTDKPLEEMRAGQIVEALAFEFLLFVIGLGAGLILLARHFGISPWWIVWPAFVAIPALDIRAARTRRRRIR